MKPKPITKSLIEKHLGTQKSITRTFWGAWFIELQSGASVKITRHRVNFGKYRDRKNRAEVDEWVFEEEVEASLALGQEIWGGIRLFGSGTHDTAIALLKYAESAGINTGDQGLVLRHFGDKATLKYCLRGWKVSQLDGSYVKVVGNAIEEVVGSADIFRAALKLLHELGPGNVVVRGKPELILMGVQLGKTLDIEVIPESNLEMFYTVTGPSVQSICIALAYMQMGLWQAIVVGWATGLVFCMIGARVFWKQLRALARRQGLKIKGVDPTMHTTRKATIDDAKSRGMLL
jgi:hypothetical protein